MTKASAKALRQRQNELTAGYFALAALALMAIFTIIHWIDVALQRRSLEKDGPFVKRVVLVGRRTRSILLRKVPGFTSIGHAFIFLIYIVINITLSFYQLDWSSLNNFAKRLGWVAVCNIALITFLALKNTPLAFLTSFSYERLNILHQVAGYSTIIWALSHGVVYLTAWAYSANLHEIPELANIMGIVAGFAMLTILGSALLFRKFRYEIFYVIHIAMFILILIGVGMHRPDMAKKVPAIVITAAGFWVCDRIIRAGRMLWFAYGNHATLTALPHGGVRIALKRTPKGLVPGSHCFLWIPGIRALETHPFTIASTNPLELVVKAHDGFTKDLLVHAQRNPDAVMRASIDGPYGKLPDFTMFDQVTLIGGGSGASFTFGVALGLVRGLESEAKKPVVNFIWVVKEREQLTWFRPEFDALIASSNITISIFVTRSPSRSSSKTILAQSTIHSANTNLDPEKQPSMNITSLPVRPDNTTGLGYSSAANNKETISVYERSASASSSLRANDLSPALLPRIQYTKPFIPDLIRDTIRDVASHSRIMVAACGPASMMKCTKEAVIELTKSGELESVSGRNVSVKLCIEAFGW